MSQAFRSLVLVKATELPRRPNGPNKTPAAGKQPGLTLDGGKG